MSIGSATTAIVLPTNSPIAMACILTARMVELWERFWSEIPKSEFEVK